MTDWLEIRRGEAPLVVSFPHTGTDIPPDIEAMLRSPALARFDCDWWVDRLYAFAAEELGATTVRTRLSRAVIDVNRDPGGASLYPGQATTSLCPTTTFDGEPLYVDPPEDSVLYRSRLPYFTPYHDALRAELDRLRARHPRVVLYDAHSIRSHVPRLFDGELPQFNIGTNDGRSCDPALTAAVEAACGPGSRVTNGRFKGGWITRHYGRPDTGVHAIQMELACRGYMEEPGGPWDPARAAPLQATLRSVLAACLEFAR